MSVKIGQGDNKEESRLHLAIRLHQIAANVQLEISRR